MEVLDSCDWRAIADLWAELNEFGLSESEGAWVHFRQRVHQMLDVDRGLTVVLEEVAEPVDNPLYRCLPLVTLHHGPEAEQFNRLGHEWIFREPGYGNEPAIQYLAARHGQARTVSLRRSVDQRTFDGSTMRGYFDVLEVEDRLFSAFPVANGLEINIGVDRVRGSRVFGLREQQMLHTIVQGILPLARAYVRSRGLMPGQQELSAREQQVLSYLLGPLSEKEIADRLDLSTGYLHQVVVRIYRKLGVRSRPELMAQWL
ncbi:helix-turn-helix transcriptional regulator [Persicimonas caeni]|uniref:Helix-turn-helix transcriptional regulator n=1 Tax=Persicimonas caeni TaxID=2292766 RepID=A0A4Y6PX12_PERCE|nr:helix-turn-helix transcriptional regulator [Persicimonas caeni]QDG52557.1 helix-turn-helix transcriptional regulator [Persicimonas caeni]QED33779.1 helix-turn-helix transcriptional regulator [Persicimonas caeni]